MQEQRRLRQDEVALLVEIAPEHRLVADPMLVPGASGGKPLKGIERPDTESGCRRGRTLSLAQPSGGNVTLFEPLLTH